MVLTTLEGVRDEFARATENPAHPFRQRWDENGCHKRRLVLAAVIRHLRRYQRGG